MDAMEEFFDRVVRMVLHPNIIMFTFAFLSAATGAVTFLRYSATYVHYPDVWASVSLVAGLLVLFAMRWPNKGLVSVAGAALVVAYSSRSVAILESLIRLDQPSREIEGSFVIASITWMMMAYLAFVIWRRIVIPWAVLARNTTREEWVIGSGQTV